MEWLSPWRILKAEKVQQFFIPILVLFFFCLLSGTVVFSIVLIQNIDSQLDIKINSVKKDIHYSNNVWNLNSYNTDTRLIGIYPLYLFANDGTVLDRRSPIGGFLDLSDFRRLVAYANPQTIVTVTNQESRVYSRTIIDNKKILGVVTVAYYAPQDLLISSIDDELEMTANYIYSKVSINNGILTVGNIDPSLIPYNISYTVVDSYNTIVKKSGNVNNINKVPGFIDPSYIKSLLRDSRENIVQDINTKEVFLVKINPILDSRNKTIAVIIVGQSLSTLLPMLIKYFLTELIVGLLGLVTCVFYTSKKNLEYAKNKIDLSLCKVSFSDKKGMLYINDKNISIPYATNQFYLLQVLFSKPSKRWETDEILEKFGVDNETRKWRIVYDTMVKINKKVSSIVRQKLITNQNKTYQLNPDIQL